MTLKQCLRTEKLVASLSQSESELADMEWWDGEKKPPEPKGNDSSELPAWNSEIELVPVVKEEWVKTVGIRIPNDRSRGPSAKFQFTIGLKYSLEAQTRMPNSTIVPKFRLTEYYSFVFYNPLLIPLLIWVYNDVINKQGA